MIDNGYTLVSIGLLASIVFFAYMRLKWQYSYWQHRNIPFIKPTLILGNMRDLLFMRISFGDFFRTVYDGAYSQEDPVVGMYLLHKPVLLIRNPELIKRIFVKNSHVFLNRFEAADSVHDSMGFLTLPLAKYPIWRESRKHMTEFFTSGKLKNRMYPLMLEISLELECHIGRQFQINCETSVIEVKELCALYTTDLTALLAFSIRAGSLNGNLKIRHALVEMLNPTFMKGLNFFIIFFLPHLATLLGTKVFPESYVKFIKNMLIDNLKQRTHKTDNINYKNDLIDILLNFKSLSRFNQKNIFTQNPDFIASQVAIMLVAGFETSSSLIAFILFELARQPSLQHKLQTEIKSYLRQPKENGKTLKYEDLVSMPYLNMVVSEGLRMYPTASFINREFIPSADEDTFSLRPFLDFDLPRGMPAYVSILGLHRDRKYWPDPHKFDPERFHPDRIKLIQPITYIPFGIGPHNCIGSRLGVIQVKLGLVHILKSYAVETCSLTPEKIIFEPKSFMLQNREGIKLKFHRNKEFSIN